MAGRVINREMEKRDEQNESEGERVKEREKPNVRVRKSEENAERECLTSRDYSNRIMAQRENGE